MGNQRASQTKNNQTTPTGKTVQAKPTPLATHSPVHPMLQLQRKLGNQAVNRLIQTKMQVGEPDDVYEKEADSVAAQVMRMPAPPVQNQTEEEEIQTKPIGLQLQSDEEEIQTKPIALQLQSEEEEIQTKAIGLQLQSEEEDIQTKPYGLQLQSEEEEIQTKPYGLQLQSEEEEIQTKPIGLQLQSEEEEIQTKANPGQTPTVSPNLETKIQSRRGTGQPLPDSTRAFMEPRFGHDFSGVKVHTDSIAASAAQELNAQAFTTGQDIFFGSGYYEPHTTTGKTLLAHELTHTIQQQPTLRSASLAEPSAPEQVPTAPKPSLPPLSSEEAGDNQPLETKTEPESKIDTGKNDLASQEIVEPKVEDTEPSLKSTEEEPKSDLAVELEEPSAMEGEEVAQVSSLSLAGSSDQALARFMESSPSQIAATQPSLGTQLDSKINQEQQAEVENAPILVAKTNGTVEEGLKAPEQISVSGGAQISDGVTGADPGELQASPPENLGIPPNNKQNERLVDRQDDNSFLSWFRNNIKSFLSNISTDARVNTSAGERPNVELEGEADPGRMANQRSDAESQLKAQRDMTANTFKHHPGQQNIQPKKVNEQKTPQLSSEAFVSIETSADTGAMDYVNAPLPPGVRNHADELLKPTLDSNLADAKAQTQDAAQTRDRDKAGKINQAQLDTAAVNQKADKEQRDIVVANRQKVAQQQQEGINESYAQVNEFMAEADKEQAANHKVIGERVKKADGEARKELAKGEEKAEKEKEASEKKAVDKKKELEKAQEKDSWWDRAVSAVKSAVKVITSAIDTIFTALREAVKTIIENAKNAAIALINKARNWVIDQLNKFRDWAKNQVNKYLKDRFPNLAKRINQGIDGVVNTTIKGVNVVADGAIAGVEAVANGLAAALDKILSVYQTALKAAVQIAGAAITGNFAEALRIAVQAACDIAGIDSKPIFDFIDRAAGQVMAILKDPKTFFNNVMEAIGGGVSNFSKNIQQHLIKGLIGWLTGALSEVNLSLPETFDGPGILSLVMEILGLTYENIKGKVMKKFPPAASVFGEVEQGMEIVQKLVTEGPMALWEEVKQKFSNLKETVISGIQDFVIKTVAKEGIAWLLGLLTPAGAIAKLLKLAFDFVMFLVERFGQIKDFVMSVYNSITAIASGNLSQAKQAVEDALSRSLPVVISLLASLAGLGGIGKTVKNIIGKVAKPVNKIVDSLVERMVKFAKKLLKKGKAAVKRLIAFWRVKKSFKLKDGSSHTLSFKKRGRKFLLFMASEKPKSLVEILKDKNVEIENKEMHLRELNSINNDISADANNQKLTDKDRERLQKEYSRRVEELAKALSKHLNLVDDLPPTTVTYEQKNGKAFKVVAKPLTLNPGNTKGSGSSNAGDIPGWKHVTNIDNHILNKKTGQRGPKNWHKTHLLHDQLHGPGVSWNLVTATRKANIGAAGMKGGPEKKGLELVRDKKIISYTSKVDYWQEEPGFLEVKDFARLITVNISILTPKEGGSGYDEQELPKYKVESDKPAKFSGELKPLNINTASRTDMTKLGINQTLALVVLDGRKPDTGSGTITYTRNNFKDQILSLYRTTTNPNVTVRIRGDREKAFHRHWKEVKSLLQQDPPKIGFE
ncbi:MAG: DUF4157 domain-containing protein [Moorea sp. SIO2I5]|nr:DUF4157 domain-containing protein [Moorena sp. SIO2I5]